jgi:hypothetical protein
VAKKAYSVAKQISYVDMSEDDFVKKVSDSLDGADIPLFSFYEIIKSNHLNFAGIIALFNKIHSTLYIDELRNKYNPRIQ